MRQILPRLFVGAQADDPPDDTFALVRAAKHPFHMARCGKLTPGHPHYFAIEEHGTLILNVIDPPVPLFSREVFDAFLKFSREQWLDGKNLLITCNQGKSRSVSLALLFCAKILGNIDGSSYDNAWDQFEELSGAPYEPGKGIETWLREHWAKLPNNFIPYIEGAATAESTVSRVKPEDQLTEEEAEALVMTSPLVHFSGWARIKDKDANLTPPDGVIEPSVFQHRAVEAYEWCMAQGLPVRLILGPKPRQSGGSTIASQICYHHTQRMRCGGMVIGDQFKRTEGLWAMFNEMAENDRCKDLWGTRHEWDAEKARFTYKDEDGNERSVEWRHDTARDPRVGMSGTRQVLWFSECGRYGKDGKVTDLQVISNASSSVPDKPGTLIIMESTAEGANGVFFTRVKGAVTLEQRMAGEIGNGWIKVFCAWHECPDYQLPRIPQYEEYFRTALDDEEKRGVQLYGWTAEQLAWRRSKIKGQFEGNLSLFKQEFPSSEMEAFQSSGNPRFDLAGLTRLEEMALIGHGYAEMGTLEKQRDGVVMFVSPGENPWLWVKERPMYGARYLVFGDSMTGEQSKGSLKRDEHAYGVWRAAYKDPDGVLHETKLVAAITHPLGVRWDEDVIAERAHLLSLYYGNCTMAIEVNEAMGILHALKGLNANLWQRTKADEASGVTGQTLKIPGWKTTGGPGGNRSILVGGMAKAIREQEIAVHFLPLVEQLRSFVTHEDGTCSARAGSHDDYVMGAAIGLQCLDCATLYRPPERALPTSHVAAPDMLGKGSGAMG